KIGAGIGEQHFDAALGQESQVRFRDAVDLQFLSRHGAPLLFQSRRLSIPPSPAGNSPHSTSEELQEFGPADTGLPQDGDKRAWREIVSMYRHDRLAGRIIPVPQEMMRAFG